MSTAKQKKIPYHVWIVISCCMLMTTGIAIPLTCASTFFPKISEALGVGSGPVSMIMTIQNVVVALLLPFAGKMLATKNVRTVLTTAMIIYAVGMGSMSFHSALWQFYVSGVILGIGGAFVIYLTVPIMINNWFKAKVGLAMGVSFAFAGIGATVFSPVTGWAIDTYGWRPAYMFLAVAMLTLSLPFTIFVMCNRPEDIGLRPYGDDGTQSAADKAKDAASGVSTSVALRTPQFYMLFFFAGLLGVSAAMLYQVTSYMVSLGYSTTMGASVVAAGTIGVTCGKVGVGYLNDKIGLSGAAIAGITTGICGILIMLFGVGFGLPAMFAGCVLYGVSYACTALEPPIVVRRIFGNKNYTQIFSYIMTCSAMGTAFGTSILGFIRDLTGSYAASLGLAMCLLIIALTLVLLALKTGKNLEQKYAPCSSVQTHV